MQQHSRYQKGRGIIPLHDLGMHPHGTDQGADTQHHQKIYQVGAQHISKGNGIAALYGRRQADRKLRQTGAKGHDGEADYNGRNPKIFRQGRSPAYKPVSALYQKRNARNQQ